MGRQSRWQTSVTCSCVTMSSMGMCKIDFPWRRHGKCISFMCTAMVWTTTLSRYSGKKTEKKKKLVFSMGIGVLTLVAKAAITMEREAILQHIQLYNHSNWCMLMESNSGLRVARHNFGSFLKSNLGPFCVQAIISLNLWCITLCVF